MKPLILILLSVLSTGLHAREDARDVWTLRCKSCHGADGRAQTKTGKKEAIPDFTSQAWQKSVTDDQIRRTIANGSTRNPKMKAFKGRLKPEQIDALTKFIRALK